jgi:hypothetical protein
LHLKLTLVGATILVTMAHTRLAKTLSPAARGTFDLIMLLLSLGIFAAAIRL